MFCVSVFIVLVSVVAVSLAGVFESLNASLMSRNLSSDFRRVYSYSARIRIFPKTIFGVPLGAGFRPAPFAFAASHYSLQSPLAFI